MKIDWKSVSRQEAVIEVLRFAARVIESDGPVAVSVSLAGSGAQYFSDRVQALGEESALFTISRLVPQAMGFGNNPTAEHHKPRWLSGLVLRRSSVLKHANRPAELEDVLLAPELATMLVLCAIGDCYRATGTIDDELTAFQKRQQAKIMERLVEGNPSIASRLRDFEQLIRPELLRRGFTQASAAKATVLPAGGQTPEP